MIAAIPVILPVLICLALIVVAIAATAVMTWNEPPWWRTNPTPRRQINNDKDAVRIYRIRHRHPEVFATEEFTELAKKEQENVTD